MLPKQNNYSVGIYMRLSKDDERAGESLSIENQRAILTEYVSKQGWTIYDEYVGGNSDLWRKIWTIYTFLVWYDEYGF